ncbi:UNVERIFIED_CONTAM: D-ribose pyranase, partial [Bacillus amyloliquefaciens DSM 7 = ATCC 23350]
MQKHGRLNSHIAKVLAGHAHRELIAIDDAGLPVRDVLPKCGLSLTAGVPAYRDVTKLVAGEMADEKVIAASEIKDANPENANFLENHFQEQKIEYLYHEEMKRVPRKA